MVEFEGRSNNHQWSRREVERECRKKVKRKKEKRKREPRYSGN
jgi:hypothetical protein